MLFGQAVHFVKLCFFLGGMLGWWSCSFFFLGGGGVTHLALSPPCFLLLCYCFDIVLLVFYLFRCFLFSFENNIQ